jgi:hypothetical protein
MSFEYGVETYKALAKILKIKFGLELKDSGIILQDLFLMKNLISDKESYLLIVNDTHIRFKTQKDFVLHFIHFLNSNIKTLEERYNYMTRIQTNEFTDKVKLEIEYKTIDYHMQRQKDLLLKMVEIKEKINNCC